MTASTAAATAAFVEQFAVIMEAEGTPRVCGRLFALLLISDEALSLDEIAEQLELSKASVSINARTLEDRGKIERVTRAGDRRDYYQIGEDIIERGMEDRMTRVRRIQQVIATARTERAFKDGVVAKRLELVDAAHQHILEANQRALDAWRAKRHKTTPSNKSR